MRAALAVMVLATACARIHVPARGSAVEPPFSGPRVEACLLVQEMNERFVFSGAAVLNFDTWHGLMGSILVRTPSATLLIDPNFGSQLADDLNRAPWYSKVIMGDASTKRSTLDAFTEAGLSPREVSAIAISHTHWDHVGGVRDFAPVPVMLNDAEWQWAQQQTGAFAGGTMPHMLEGQGARVKTFTFDGPPVLGFRASHDVLGDGSVIAVPLEGHTPGSTGYLFALSTGVRVLYVGDAAWEHRGVDQPVQKNPLVPIDADLQATGDTLGRLHAAQRDNADLQILTAHDFAGWYRLPMCREFAPRPQANRMP